MTLEKQTFTCDQTGEKYEVSATWKENHDFFIKKIIEAPKIFPWDEVVDRVLVYVDNPKNDHFLYRSTIHNSTLLRLSNEWQLWRGGGEKPFPDNVEIDCDLRRGCRKRGLVKEFCWLDSTFGNPEEIIAFKVLNIGDYKYPDEV